jgi:hypothetical protein
MLTGLQFYPGLSLSAAEVVMIVVLGDGLLHGWQIGIDDQVVMAGTGLVNASRCNAHTTQAELDGKR